MFTMTVNNNENDYDDDNADDYDNAADDDNDDDKHDEDEGLSVSRVDKVLPVSCQLG